MWGTLGPLKQLPPFLEWVFACLGIGRVREGKSRSRVERNAPNFAQVEARFTLLR